MEHLQSKYMGTGHSDSTKFEWATHQHRYQLLRSLLSKVMSLRSLPVFSKILSIRSLSSKILSIRRLSSKVLSVRGLSSKVLYRRSL